MKHVFLAPFCATAFTGCLGGLVDEDLQVSYSVDDLVGTWSTTTPWNPDSDPLAEGVESSGAMVFSYGNSSVELTSLFGPNDEELDLSSDLVIATNVYQGWLDLTKQNMLGDATHDSERNCIPEDSYTGISQAHK